MGATLALGLGGDFHQNSFSGVDPAGATATFWADPPLGVGPTGSW